MKSKTKVCSVGVLVGVGTVALLTPSLVSGGARTSLGTGKAAAAVAKPFLAQLKGTAEVPGPGDPDGEGAASITIDPVTGELCSDLRATNVAAVAMAHIHRGGPTVAGPIVVDLAPPNTTSAACVTIAPTLAAEIATTPANFYVNVHNAEFPAGAMRGQLAPSASTSGATQLLNEPLRAYDSRTSPEGILALNSTRVISLATGVDGAGASHVAVPPGATGAILRVTIDQPTAPGFLKVYSNALPTAPSTSNVNWYETGAIAGADVTVAVDALSKIKVTSGGSQTHVIVDVVGYVF